MTSGALGSFRFFDDDRASLDSSLAFFGTAQALATDAAVVVDVGCGRGAAVDPPDGGRPLQDLRAGSRTIVGIDVDPAAAENPVIDEFRLIQGGRWPLNNSSVDLAISDWVLEHVEEPAHYVAELRRVLRPGGAFLARTISRHSLLSAAARAVPNDSHTWVLQRLQPSRDARDVFPTAYRMNSRSVISVLFGPDFDWAVIHRPTLDQYFGPCPRIARLVAVAEPRFPRNLQSVIIISARLRFR